MHKKIYHYKNFQCEIIVNQLKEDLGFSGHVNISWATKDLYHTITVPQEGDTDSYTDRDQLEKDLRVMAETYIDKRLK